MSNEYIHRKGTSGLGEENTPQHLVVTTRLQAIDKVVVVADAAVGVARHGDITSLGVLVVPRVAADLDNLNVGLAGPEAGDAAVVETRR